MGRPAQRSRSAADQVLALEHLAALLARLIRTRDLRADAQDRDAICSHLVTLGFDDTHEEHSHLVTISGQNIRTVPGS